jgi:trans-2,3-dihydro-3-hydroxyanthranilate isomerase
VVAGGRKLDFDACEREHRLAAVGLVADDDDGVAAARCGFADLLGRRTRREPLVDLGVAEAERRGRLAGADQRAREDGVGLHALGAQARAELARLHAALGGQRPELVRLPRRCLRVSDEDQMHCGANDSLAPMAGYRYVVADVFTDAPLTGNQLAVFTDARAIPEDTLQSLAREMNFSETTFVYPPEADGHAKMRIFTPSEELPFAGHPTLGTAFVLAGPLQLMEIRLETGRGTIPVQLEREGARIVFGRMTQPAPTVVPFERAGELEEYLGVESRLPVELYDNGLQHVYVALGSEEDVAGLRPDWQRLAGIGNVGVNCFAGSGMRWKTRMFAPRFGIDEDPATGSAAGPLALHLARHGEIAFGDEIEIEQGVEIDRPSKLYACAHSPERIEVGGSAVIVARGEFRL